MGTFCCQSVRCTADLLSMLCWYEMSTACSAELDELNWVQPNCAGTVPVACDVRGDIARRAACFCSAQLVTGRMAWGKTVFVLKIIRN